MSLHKILEGSQLALRAAAGGTLAYYFAASLGLQHPIYALVATIIVTDFSPTETRRLGIHRLIATAIGAICGVAFSVAVEPAPWTVALGILTPMVISHVCNASAGAKVAGYVSAIIIFTGGTAPWHHASHRVIETVLGIVVGWVLSLIPRIIELKEPASRDIKE